MAWAWRPTVGAGLARTLGFTLTPRRLLLPLGVLVIAGLAVAAYSRTEQGYAVLGYLWSKLRGGYSIEERLAIHGPTVEARVKPAFLAAGLPFPPAQLAYVAFKDQKSLHVYSRASKDSAWKRVMTYQVLGMSGTIGPKLREGDLQVPEGIYRAESLNPNSKFHLSIRLNYPNAYDRSRAAAESRTKLGGDIMIHGTLSSIGCLAMGNQAAEDLFVLAAHAGKEQVEIVVAPTDLRRSNSPSATAGPPWLQDLYRDIKSALSQFPSEA